MPISKATSSTSNFRFGSLACSNLQFWRFFFGSDSIFGPLHFFRRRFVLQNLAFCLCFLSSQKRFNKQSVRKKCRLSAFAGPRRRRGRKLPNKCTVKNSREFPPSLCPQTYHFSGNPPPGGSPNWSLEMPLPRYGKRNFRLIYIPWNSYC